MQLRWTTALTLLAWLLAASAHAEPPQVIIGETGLALGNSAPGQDKFFIANERALTERIACLLQDVDKLLAGLHALPSEWQGAEIQSQPVTAELQAVIDLALQYNLELKPMRSELAVLAARTRQTGARMDPMLEFMWMDIPGPNWPLDSKLDDASMSKVALTYSQTFDSYGKRDLKRGIAHLDEKLQQLKLAEMERNVIADVTDSYFMLAGTQARLRVMSANIDLMHVLLELAEQKFALGYTPQAAVLNMQAELTNMERERLDMQQMLASQQVMLSAMLGYPPGFDPASLKFSAAYPLPVEIKLDTTALRQAALDRLPDYQGLKLRQTQQGLMLEMARREYHPDYTLTAGYTASWKERDMLSAGIMVPLSLNKKERQDARVQEAYAMQAVLDDEQRVQESSLRQLIEVQLVDLQRRRELIDLSRLGLVPQTRLALDSNIAAYAANMMDLSDLVMAQQALLTTELDLEQNYIAYIAGLAKLQVITAGAFDPAPYLAPGLDSGSDQPVVPLDDAVPAAKPAGQSFINTLDLPQTDANAPTEPLPGNNASSPDSEATSDAPAGVAETTAPVVESDAEQAEPSQPPEHPDDFYNPFHSKRSAR